MSCESESMFDIKVPLSWLLSSARNLPHDKGSSGGSTDSNRIQLVLQKRAARELDLRTNLSWVRALSAADIVPLSLFDPRATDLHGRGGTIELRELQLSLLHLHEALA